jgi:cyclopropane fatty-acyl-phospholipid synthase-like methyltransferase
MRPQLTTRILCLALIALASCGTTPEVRAIPERLNAKFLSDDLKVEDFKGSFEGESREVYRERQALAAALQAADGHVIADIGSGTGAFLSVLSKSAGPKGQVIATDISSVFVAKLRERADAEGLSNIHAQVCGERECGLRPTSVDRIFICDVYHHFAYPRTTNASLFEALRPGGELLLVDFIRIEGQSRKWLLGHVRAGQEVFRAEVEDAGFEYVEDVQIEGFEETYVMRFRKR